MSTVLARTSQRHDKSVAAALVIAFAVAGWAPALAAVWHLPYITRMLLPVSFAMVLFALGLVYDAAERLLGAGRGLYAAAIFCSLPATGLVASDPARLAIGALTMVTALGVWLAVRATGEERPFFLGMLTFLCLVAFYLYGAAALPTLFAFALALRVPHRAAPALFALPLLAGAVGWTGHALFTFGLPLPRLAIAAPETWPAVLLPWLPWGPALLCASWLLMKRRVSSAWWPLAIVAGLLMVALAAFGQVSFMAAAAFSAPLLALLVAELVHTQFFASNTTERPAAVRLPLLNVAAILFVIFAATLGLAASPPVLPWEVAVGALLAAALVWTVVARLPRASFAALFAAGLLFGHWAAQRAPLFPEGDAETGPVPLPFVALALLTSAGLFTTLQLARHKTTRRWVDDFVYGGENFHRYAAGTLKPVTLGEQVGAAYRFVIFGDAAGAETDSGARRESAAAFRALGQRLAEGEAAFAVSLGDLARQATPYAYRRMQTLLARIPVPLAVTPGNHDLFVRDRWNAAQFRALFGADNFAFTLGPVTYIVLNNAWGYVGETQFAWLEAQLANCTSPFVLLFCHKPPFDPRRDTFYGMEERPHAERLHALCREHRVQAVFSGHIHALLTETRDGVRYVISGGGGSRLAEGGRFHYLDVDVTAAKLTICALPLDAPGDEPLATFDLLPRA